MISCCNSKAALRQLVDERGRSLGWVVRPRQRDVVGSMAGTVLLRRQLPAEFVDREQGARRTA
jgi:hypothetical protein